MASGSKSRRNPTPANRTGRMQMLAVTIAVALLCAGPAAAHAEANLPEDDALENDVSLLQSVFRVTAASAGPGPKHAVAPNLVVDLDAAPELRWQNVTAHWLAQGVYPGAITGSPKPEMIPELRGLLDAVPVRDEYLREMRGIVQQLGLPESMVDSLRLMTMFYEVGGVMGGPGGLGCSGLLAAMPDGTVVHGRNMDYFGFEVKAGNRTLYFPDATVDATFIRGGKPLYTSVAWPGNVGVNTAMRFGGWSFEQNTRFHSAKAAVQHALEHGSVGYMLSARHVLETTEDFETALVRLQALKIMGPSYFVVAGAGAYEGAIISRDEAGGLKSDTPLMRRLSLNSAPFVKDGVVLDDWNLFQANNDVNKPIPHYDPRQTAEERRLAGATQGMVSVDWVWSHMLTKPVYNPLTVFTSVYVPATGYHRTIANLENGHPTALVVKELAGAGISAS